MIEINMSNNFQTIKLNLGCGGVHKKGYINVDAFNLTIADQKMEATDLQIEDNTIDLIEMDQVLEHLGLVQGIYTLSECYRTLKPNGLLVIETPDLIKSFDKFVRGGWETRKYLLTWIYGLDMPGMQHICCFPEDLLKETLKQIGFKEIKSEKIEFDKYQPILRMTCKKTDDSQVFQLITIFRKKLVKNNFVLLHNQIESLEIERLIEFFIKETLRFVKTTNKKFFKEIIIEGAVFNPKITRLFLEEVSKTNYYPLSKKENDDLLSILDILIELDFVNILLNELIKTEKFIGKQNELFELTVDFGRKNVKNLLNSTKENRNEIVNELKKYQKSHLESGINIYSNKLLMLKSNSFFQKGIKEFNLGNYENAIVNFEDSISLFRDQVLAFWNLGRLHTITKDRRKAKFYYENTSKLLNNIKLKNNLKINKLLKKELKNLTSEKLVHPIISLERL
jgi:tetratricopeptide (TPR) repeat protein